MVVLFSILYMLDLLTLQEPIVYILKFLNLPDFSIYAGGNYTTFKEQLNAQFLLEGVYQ